MNKAPSIPYRDWTEKVVREAWQSRKERIFITNSVDPLYVRQYSFEWLNRLPEDIPYSLVIDDSHGLGIRGKKGGGILTSIKPPPNVKLIVVSSLAKAFGIPGGVIMGSKELIRSIYKSPYFGGASPIVPAYLYAFLKSQKYYMENRRKLLDNSREFLNKIRFQNSFNYLRDYPVFYTPKNQLADFLSKHEVFISSFSYPTPEDPKITRIVISSLHTIDDINLLTELVNQFYESV